MRRGNLPCPPASIPQALRSRTHRGHRPRARIVVPARVCQCSCSAKVVPGRDSGNVSDRRANASCPSSGRSMRTVKRTLMLALLLLLADAARGYSWSPGGHMLSAAIAYRELRAADPAALRSVLTLLRKHPDYQARWLPRMNALNIQGIDRDMYLFALTARWPDDIRDNPQQNRTGWHFRDLPFKPAGEPASVVTTEAPRDNMVRAFADNVAIISDAQSPAVRKV